jgi:hypothetical protein
MSNNERFIVASLRERLALGTFTKNTGAYSILEMTPVTGYDNYDAILGQEEGHLFVAEVKVRIHKSTQYPDWIIEEGKYDALKEQADLMDATPLYINIHPDGIQVWDLNELDEPLWIQTSLPITTQGDTTFIDKTNGGLYSRQAKFYPMDINITKLTLQANQLYNKHFNN